MNNTIYNDIKNIYRFIFKNYIFFLISLLVFFFITLACSIFSFKFAYHLVLMEYKIKDKTFEINKYFKYPLHIHIKDEIYSRNKDSIEQFLISNNLYEGTSPILKSYVQQKIYRSNQYQLYKIDYNLSKKKNNIIIFKKKIFTNPNDLYEKISQGIIFSWKENKKYQFNRLDKKHKQYLNLIKKADPSSFSYTTVSKLNIEYFNIFLIFLFIIFNVVSIIMIKEIKNDNIK